MTGPDLPGSGHLRWEAAVALILALTVVFVYALTDANPLFWDEYYHLLAARSWAENGTLAIGEGEYARAVWFSVTVGWLFRIFGESIFIARLPGAVALALAALAVFLWLRVEVGRSAGWIASAAVCLSPLLLINSVMVRFYGIVGLAFLLGCIAAAHAADTGRPAAHRLRLGFAALLLLTFCAYTTLLSRLWVGTLLIWVAGAAALEVGKSRNRLNVFGVAALVALAAGVWAMQSGWLSSRWAAYQSVPSWGVPRGGDVRWYEQLMRQDYPMLWALLPAAAVLAITRRPRLGTMAAVVFGAGICLLSLGGAKGERYIVPLIPFFFILWGIAVAEVLPALRGRISALLALVPTPRLPRRAARLPAHALMALVAGFVLLTNPGFSRVRHVLRDDARSLDRPVQGQGASPAAWDSVAIALRPLYDEVDVVITSNSIQALYHVGDYDVAMHPVPVLQLEAAEFDIDVRTGRPMISSLESLTSLVDRHAHGLVFGERWRWNHPVEGFTEEVTEYVVTHMEQVPLPPDLGVSAYRW